MMPKYKTKAALVYLHIPIGLVLVMAVNDTFGNTEETILVREL